MQTSQNKKKFIPLYVILMLVLVCVTAGCSKQEQAQPEQATVSSGDSSHTLVIGAYSVAKDAVGELLPKFQEEWKAKTGQTINFQESYEASGTQARAIVGGFEADVALLAMESDIDKLVKAKLVTTDWKQTPNAGMITRSIVVLGTRAGNPKGIQDFQDLTKPGVKVLYPNPKTSGGAQWDINAIYGAGLKLSEEQEGKRDPAAAKAFLEEVHQNVESLDKSGRSSMAAFEYGVGDVIVTYENELLARIAKGVKYDIVVPKNTILIENPAVVVDKYADKHGNRELAEAFIAYLRTPEAQRIFAKHGFRSVDPDVFAETKASFPTPAGLFDINYLGGWDEVRNTLYSKRGVWYQVLAGL
ncbi:sulfate ABC transporter substrate-binding protein [Paenibacillus silvae]|uniref:sulfate ABC transporter substrate-binding protein n=1 Tax=Paenibacillus silvae TaxID=1325358 RepID=UPI002003D695|nr:sulfate ABC transporter substrate-binding protein [Paenibacillus silvae]MCK6074780.1 sulfate ABC transporter substrate-binding protein [Paenibacillus silvae]MCK6147745.1 sulfate ABC transporter substrate-binding protein [Paenibacillus silvae]MCK6266043.1 sulfate ABC transporter substrate-binding protein [Paenibacillus silvae]